MTPTPVSRPIEETGRTASCHGASIRQSAEWRDSWLLNRKERKLVAGKLTEDDLRLFDCPVSQEMMTDPVIFSSGKTVMDRASAQNFMNIAAADGRLPQCLIMQTPMLPVAAGYSVLKQAIDIHRGQQQAGAAVDLTQV